MSRVEKIGDATLYLGDCLEILPTLGPMEAVVMDPPYGLSYKTGHRNKNTPWQGQIIGDDSTHVRDEIIKILGPDCPMLVFGSRKVQTPLGVRMILVWDKGPALGMGDLTLPWKPTSEEIYVLGTGFVGPRDEGSVLYCPPVQSMAKNGRVHPNEKPVSLLIRLLRKMPGRIACDPCMGSGSTGVACVWLGRHFVGIEIEERYFTIACDRIRRAYEQPRLFKDKELEPVQPELFAGGER